MVARAASGARPDRREHPADVGRGQEPALDRVAVVDSVGPARGVPPEMLAGGEPERGCRLSDMAVRAGRERAENIAAHWAEEERSRQR